MSDVIPAPEECEVDPDLMRRVAWGMIAGKSKAAIAEAEDLTAEECETVCTAPGMFSILNVWANFLERRREGGRRKARMLTGWCVEHVFQHAPERLAKSEIWRLDRLSSVMLDYGFAIVFGWMLGFLDGVMGVPGARRKVLDDFRQNLVDLLCWAVEETFREKMLEQYSVDLLIAKDGAFQAAIAGREFFELGMSGAFSMTEDGADKRELPASELSTASDSPPLAVVELPRPVPGVTRQRQRSARSTSSLATRAPAVRAGCSSTPRPSMAGLSRPPPWGGAGHGRRWRVPLGRASPLASGDVVPVSARASPTGRSLGARAP